jgi:hypothetical protein
MTWGEILKNAVSEVAYARDAKATGKPILPHFCIFCIRVLLNPELRTKQLNRHYQSPRAFGWAKWEAPCRTGALGSRGTSGLPRGVTAATVLHGAQIPAKARLSEQI